MANTDSERKQEISLRSSDKFLIVGIEAIAVLALNYAVYWWIVLAVYHGYLLGRFVFVVMIEYFIVVVAIAFYLQRRYATVFDGKRFPKSSRKGWKRLDLGFQGLGTLLVGIFVVAILTRTWSIYMIISLGVTGAFLSFFWAEATILIRVIENRDSVRHQTYLSTKR